MRILRLLACSAVLLTLGPAGGPAQSRRPARRPIPDLNGPWDSDEEGVVIVYQNGRTIQVLTNNLCEGIQRPFYIQGTLTPPNQTGVMTITGGTMHRCESQHPIIQTCCAPRDTWQTTFKADVVGDYSITGTRVGEFWTADTDSNGAVNKATCKLDHHYDDPIVLLRQSPTSAPPNTPGAGPSPSPTPGNNLFDDLLEDFQEGWDDLRDWVEDIPDTVEFTEDWEQFKNERGVRRYILHSDHSHTEEGETE